MSSSPRRPLLLLATLAVVFAMFAAGAFVLKRALDRFNEPAPVQQGCLFTAGDATAFLTPEQSKWASVIVAESIRRDLPARAATVALATAMQESGLRNIDYGDRDSVGLFQQRPSQGWGSVDQIMDAWYSSGKFYAALVKVKNWQTGDINDVAQEVQRSGVPDGYRKHVPDAQVIASVLTGHTPAGVSCAIRDTATPEPSLHDEVLTKGLAGKITRRAEGNSITITATSAPITWAAAHLMMANARDARVTGVDVSGQTWTMAPKSYAAWGGAPVAAPTKAVITLG